MQAVEALIKMSGEIPLIKKDLKVLKKDIIEVMDKRQIAYDHLYLVVNAVNRGCSLQEIKKIAVRGMKKSDM